MFAVQLLGGNSTLSAGVSWPAQCLVPAGGDLVAFVLMELLAFWGEDHHHASDCLGYEASSA